ncbi:MAG: radical SAM protein [Candidatus Omnitrophica bacterium]|nr:radical SAM protein [Candidatus Omnitrophota bacterium]
MNLDKLRILGAAKDKLLAGPKSIYIDINTNCNLNCNYCWIHSPLVKKPLYKKPLQLELSDIIKITKEADRWNAGEIVISGDGEPTLHPNFKKIVKYLTRKPRKIYLTTNATFKKDLLSSVAKINYLYITLSAPSQKLYNQIQSPKNSNIYQQVIRNIKILTQLRDKYNKPYINLAYIVNSTNFRKIPEMLKLAEELKIDKINFRIMEPTKYTKKLLLSKEQKLKLIKIISQLLNKKFSFQHNLSEIKNGLTNPKQSPYHIKQCFTGWFNLFIDFNKKVGLCCHNEKLIIGDLKKESLEKIWQSKKAQKLRLRCKYEFDIKKAPFKGECEWCHWYKQNQKIYEQINDK